MIQPDARSRLTPDDVTLLLGWVTGAPMTHEDVDVWLQNEPLDDTLDRPEVAEGLRRAPLDGPSPSLYFYVTVRRALLSRGLDDRPIADYCAALLREFGRGDRAHRVATVDDHRHGYLVDILADARESQGARRFRVYAHLGNYALWLAGVFPDRIEAVRCRRGGPNLSYYDAMGGAGYQEAAALPLAARTGLDELYRKTAERFPLVREALTEATDGWHRRRAA